MNLQDNDGYSALHWAVHCGADLNLIKFLVNRGADVSLKNGEGRTALHIAHDNPRIARFLISRGANVSENDNQGFTPIYYAENLDSVKFFMGHGGNVRDMFSKIPHLDNPSLIKFLLDNGADPNVYDDEGITMLYYLAEQGRWDLFELALQKGANINYVSDCLGTVLDYIYLMFCDVESFASPSDPDSLRRYMDLKTAYNSLRAKGAKHACELGGSSYYGITAYKVREYLGEILNEVKHGRKLSMRL